MLIHGSWWIPYFYCTEFLLIGKIFKTSNGNEKELFCCRCGLIFTKYLIAHWKFCFFYIVSLCYSQQLQCMEKILFICKISIVVIWEFYLFRIRPYIWLRVFVGRWNAFSRRNIFCWCRFLWFLLNLARGFHLSIQLYFYFTVYLKNKIQTF